MISRLTDADIGLPTLRHVLRHIQAHPEEHRQDVYFTACGTAGCVAGHTVLAHGFRFFGNISCGRDGIAGSVDDVAKQLLGLTTLESHELFYFENDLVELERISAQIASRRGEELWPEGEP